MQIGPKIRVGGTLGKIGQGIKKVAPAIGGAALGGIGGDFLGQLIQGKGVGDAINGSAGDLGKAAAGAAGIVGLPGVLNAIPGVSEAGGFLSHIPGVSGIAGALGSIPGGVGKLLGGVADYATHNPLDVLGGINSAVDAAHARDLQGKAEGLAMDNYNERAPLRAAGVAGLLKPAVPDMSGINYGSSGSVYGKRKAS